jgi:deoxyhypusine synthase
VALSLKAAVRGKNEIMKREFKRLDLSKVKTYSVKARKSKVQLHDFSRPYTAGSTFQNFLDGLPRILAAQSFKEVVDALATAKRQQKLIVVGMGAHPIKVGLNPLLIQLMEEGLIDCLAMNGACVIHDLELALAGQTSEDVEEGLDEGVFGMVEETSVILNESIREGVQKGLGIGESVGKRLLSEEFPHREHSLLAAGIRLGIPVTVHVAIGTDIIHMHPSVNGEALGEGSLRDFQALTAVVSQLEGGVYLNIGSAVILPEVFLKALTLARNLGHAVQRFTTVNMDFIQHYRPTTNVVKRPTQQSGRGYSLIGHHEIMFPLLVAALLEELRRTKPK